MKENFLNQFTKTDNKENVKNNLKLEANEKLKTNNLSGESSSTQAEVQPIVKNNHSALGSENAENEKSYNKLKPSLYNEKKHRNSQKIPSTEHIVEKDEKYQNRKRVRYGIIGGSAIVGCLLIIFIVRLMNQVEIKDFVGTSISEAKTWALTNQITLEVDEVFDTEHDEFMIIDQSVKANGKLQKGSVLKLTVSKGADPDERIEIPDLETMTLNEVNEWRRSLRLDNITVREEYDDEVEAGQFIKKEFARDVDEENYHRRDGLVVYMSKGEEVFETNISVPDFKDKSKTEVEKWAKENEIELTIEERASSSVQRDDVISQSIEAGEKIAKRDEMTVVISLGKAVSVPNFANFTSEDATSADQGLPILVQRRYSATVPFGRLISQSLPTGNEIIIDDEMPTITVIYSEGQPYMENLINESEHKIPEYFHNFTSRGANITYTINYVDSNEPKGNIVWMSKHSQFLSMTDHININVSRGNLNSSVTSPDGMLDE